MFLYSCIVLPVALIFMILSIAIYKGKTNLIHDYHQKNVTDKEAYGKAFGKALAVIAVSIFISGIIGLFGDSDFIALTSIAVMFIGFIIGFGCIIAVQKKYNNGLF